MSIDAVSCRRTKTSRSSAAFDPELLHPEVFEPDQVDACELLHGIVAGASRVRPGQVAG